MALITDSDLVWPIPNLWFGVSAEDQATFDERVELLGQLPAAVRFVSAEPLLGSIDCGNAFDDPPDRSLYRRVDWVIAGGESGPGARPSHPEWFRYLRDQCAAARVPFFFKQWGEWMPRSHSGAGMMKRDGRWGTACVDGKFFEKTTCWNGHDDDGSGEAIMFRVGKKATGRLLDGRVHEDYPA